MHENRYMPTSDSASTSRRLLALLSLLQSRRDWSAPMLARRLGISERTVRRDVERLRELDYAIESTRGPDGGYRLGAGAELPPLLLDDEQAVAVAIALRTASSAGADIEDAAERALQTIARIMPSRLAHRIAGLAAASAGRSPRSDRADPETLLRIGDAIRASEEVRFDYASPSSEDRSDPAPRRIEPHHLILQDGRWYLIGWVADRGAWRVYRADRMTLRTHNGHAFARREVPGGDAAAYLAGRFRGASAGDTWPCIGEATLALRLRDVLPYLGDGAAEELEPGRCRVRVGSWSWTGLAACLLRFDAELADAEPAELRTAFADLAGRVERAGGAEPVTPIRG